MERTLPCSVHQSRRGWYKKPGSTMPRLRYAVHQRRQLAVNESYAQQLAERRRREHYLRAFSRLLSNVDRAVLESASVVADEREFPASRFISSFGNEPYEILKPIPVVFRQGDPAGVVASFEQANISMVGETWLDAYKALQAEILDTLEDYIAHEGQLGPGPRNQLSILRTYIEIKNKTAKS